MRFGDHEINDSLLKKVYAEMDVCFESAEFSRVLHARDPLAIWPAANLYLQLLRGAGKVVRKGGRWQKVKSRPKSPSVVIGTGKSDVRVVAVDNPLYMDDHAGEASNYRKIDVVLNLKESAITNLAARGIIDEAQAAAAVRFRHLWEAIGGSGARAIDYTKEPVDGGGRIDPLSEKRAEAFKQLTVAKSLLGVKGYSIICRVAGEGYGIHELTSNRRERATLMDYLKDGLDILAEEWGYAVKKMRRYG